MIIVIGSLVDFSVLCVQIVKVVIIAILYRDIYIYIDMPQLLGPISKSKISDSDDRSGLSPLFIDIISL